MSDSFFVSRWVPRPRHVREDDRGGLPRGFRAAGVSAHVKPSGEKDLGLLVADAPETVSAARFTRSGVLAAPVIVSRERAEVGRLRAVVANSGNANAATGARGVDDALATQAAVAQATGVDQLHVAVASTGVIGVPLPLDRLIAGVEEVHAELRTDGDRDFADAIRTTDRFAKRASLVVELPAGDVRLTAQCKGAGMIQPNFATMLCFVQTDALLEQETADLLLGVTVKRSFDRISVDGQLSTNDTVVLMASGASGVKVAPLSEDELKLGEALDALLRQLALLIVADGEGAARIGRVVVSGEDHGAVEKVAREVANSPLVKTALNGGDPNWGRIAQAVGGALLDSSPLHFDIAIEGVTVFADGSALRFDQEALNTAVQRDEVEYVVALPGEGAETEVFFSDFGHEYVTINAEYTT
ncbi:bifunctional glutamate N-acetyltransferase/amino-acid acetyltransferase ArgJ [Conexibacter sp. JD483]|uniref:bifunctional glutamate N-acetyltransferase/amino-acid acetyltransferase ArgJ n=1 Tax=unclassified Conexibacter TaxID=2627773 RepID=UPI00271FBD95|nr:MULTISPECIES: bifunctional glutamate N-acetyltransferase/amino-acid acetyltransferase ArgJ [unclassified Conexibacter]MDO8185715.1 bifunctional glutamate N-acetyltransferase/amino-acid acetyltransferase ArgJ [Conexibacter sp. CPCC 205706]MDO8199092.1 bifunctional glutamate N-acetyltransferase/amino-acid acetyltransferase ArgJ [Conexibacter sp. CPCC 205762]MDR9370489.1 bifunctional glutamate N-acetyltransferase/amino-acid acetyltransferase ArgJ [Conexibacter sp. JD483]